MRQRSMSQHPIITRYPALGFARYRRYWLASMASVGAAQLITLGQGWLIFELSGSALQLGYLGAAAAIPNLAMTLAGGVIADRFNKRLIMLCTSGLTCLLLVILAVLDFSDAVQVWHVLAVAGGISLITGLDWPVRVAIFPQLVERSAFVSAVALNSFVWQVTRMAMPALGGLILAASDTWVIFALGAAGFATMFVTMANLEIADSSQAQTPASPLSQVAQGLTFIWRTPLFRSLLLLTFVGMFLSNSFVQILPVFADLLGAQELGYGLLLSAGGLGSIAGTLVIGTLRNLARPGLAMLAGAMASAALLMLFAWTAQQGWFYVALFLVFAVSASASVFMVASMTVLQIAVPDELRGRVMGIHTMGYSLMPLGGLSLGWLSLQFGSPGAVMISNLLFLLVLVVFGLLNPVVSQLDRTALSGDD